MEELSIEEKAKCYDEAIKRAGNLHKDAVEMGNNMTSKTCEIIFPELKESEDERIRKELIEHIKANKDADYVLFKKFSPDDVIAWLEKQGKRLDADKVIEWLDMRLPSGEEKYVIDRFKKDFGL